MRAAASMADAGRETRGGGMSGQDLTDKLEAVWTSLDGLCSGLTDEQWATPTECPGWDVKDNISHIIGTEAMLLGRPAPDHEPGEKPWVKNPIGAGNEVHVDFRRSWAPNEVLEEFRHVTGERLKTLRSWSEDDFGKESWTPIGQGTVADLLAIRIMDCWVHEQDIRRALDAPGGLEGPVAQHAFGRHAGAMPFIVGKKAGAPDGTTVVFDVQGPAGGTVAVGVEGGRAKPLAEAPSDPTVRLTMDLATFNALCTGRWDPAEALEKGRVSFDGDADIGRRIVQQMNFMI
jgi:uncharacterized protein (TIGR03083 family)